MRDPGLADIFYDIGGLHANDHDKDSITRLFAFAFAPPPAIELSSLSVRVRSNSVFSVLPMTLVTFAFRIMVYSCDPWGLPSEGSSPHSCRRRCSDRNKRAGRATMRARLRTLGGCVHFKKHPPSRRFYQQKQEHHATPAAQLIVATALCKTTRLWTRGFPSFRTMGRGWPASPEELRGMARAALERQIKAAEAPRARPGLST
jgi:hypothetical protein